jgi:hypothetical protein
MKKLLIVGLVVIVGLAVVIVGIMETERDKDRMQQLVLEREAAELRIKTERAASIFGGMETRD